VLFNDLTCDGEAEAGALDALGVDARVDLAVGVEELRLLRGRDAAAVVGHLQGRERERVR
jgi:hypothetical protein